MTTRFRIIVVTAGLLAPTGGRAVQAQATLLDGITADPALLQSEGVRKDLKLSEDQDGKVSAIARGFIESREKGFEDLRKSIQNPAELRQKRVDLVRDMKNAAWTKLKASLSDGQQARLKQLTNQRLGILAFLNPEVHSALNLTDEQKQELRTVCMKAIAERPTLRDYRLAHPDAPPEVWKDAVDAVDERAMAKMLELLTQPQRAQWAEMTGPPYKFKLGE
jgi:hypothetical protein